MKRTVVRHVPVVVALAVLVGCETMEQREGVTLHHKRTYMELEVARNAGLEAEWRALDREQRMVCGYGSARKREGLGHLSSHQCYDHYDKMIADLLGMEETRDEYVAREQARLAWKPAPDHPWRLAKTLLPLAHRKPIPQAPHPQGDISELL